MNLPIYIVSLKRDIERRNKINDVFHRLNINFFILRVFSIYGIKKIKINI